MTELRTVVRNPNWQLGYGHVDRRLGTTLSEGSELLRDFDS